MWHYFHEGEKMRKIVYTLDDSNAQPPKKPKEEVKKHPAGNK